MFRVSDDYIHHNTDANDAVEAWETFDKSVGAKSRHAKSSLKIHFFSLQMKENETLPEHLNHMKSLMSQLAAIRALVDEALTFLLHSVEINMFCSYQEVANY